ncbi:hypothetical protein RN001_000181 [Aquatica leii]|uniref:Endonuclease/exonuclease/phosphatase domain-containing protein n=1 Tax=Aquatica leii TaxID=1421715 RepID=A0AAN7Q9G1_9COLE|nr:hypothetical protein RN001_000181 [Aquatica leii]
MSIGTWNVQGISTKTEEVFKEIKKYNMDIVGLTETKKKGKGTEEKHCHQVVFIVVYAPNDYATVVKKDLFYQELTKVIDNIADRKELIILGDLNARTGSRNNDLIVGQYGENVVNDNGDRLIELCQQQALKITNGWFKHKNIHR